MVSGKRDGHVGFPKAISASAFNDNNFSDRLLRIEIMGASSDSRDEPEAVAQPLFSIFLNVSLSLPLRPSVTQTTNLQPLRRPFSPIAGRPSVLSDRHFETRAGFYENLRRILRKGSSMENGDLIELKFRLADGKDIGPRKYSPAITVASLKEKILAQWPKDKENSPKTINDMKLINAGRILDNNRTLAESRVTDGELPGGVITMHIVVLPPQLDKNTDDGRDRLILQADPSQFRFREQLLQDDAFSIQKMAEKLTALEKENAELRRRQSDHPLELQQSPDRRSPNPDTHSSDPLTDV